MVGTVTTRTTPAEPTTILTSIDDNTGVGDGSNKLIFKVLATDTNKVVNMLFSERIILKEVTVTYKNAPLGATISVGARRRTDNAILGILVQRAQIFGSGKIRVVVEGKNRLPTTAKLQVVVSNSSGTAPEDPAAAFEAVGILGISRATAA